MIMDDNHIQSDLQALLKLYGLLKNDEDGVSNITSVVLDDHTRLLLRNMLDKETQRILKEHAEIIAGRVEASNTLSLTGELQQPNESFKEKPTLSPNLAKTMAVSPSCEKYLGSKKERKPDNSDASLEIYTTPGIQAGFQEQLTWSVGAAGDEYRKKRCRVCRRPTIKKLKAIEETQFSGVAENSTPNSYIDLPNHHNKQSDGSLWNSKLETESSDKTDASYIEGKNTGPFPSNLSGVGYTDRMFISKDEATSKPAQLDCLTEEVSKAIKQIEICISEIKLRSRMNLPCLFTSQSSMPVQRTNDSTGFLMYPFIRNRPPALRNDVSGEFEASIEETKLPFQEMGRVYGQSIRASVDRIESGNWRTSPMTTQIANVGKFSIAKDHNGKGNRYPSHLTTFASVSEIGNPDKFFTSVKAGGNGHEELQTYMPFKSDSGLGVNLTWATQGKKHPSDSSRETVRHVNAIRFLPTPGISKNQTDLKHKDRDLKNRKFEEESESKASSSYSTNWGSSGSESCGSNGEDYSSSDHARRHHYATPSTSSESGASPLSHGNRSPYGSYTSNDEDDIYSSTSDDGAHGFASNNSSKSYEYSSSYDRPIRHRLAPIHSSTESGSREAGPSRIHKSEKQRGTWRRLKDKVAVIFHHHHHHHNKDDNRDFRQMVCKMSLNKHKGKTFRPEDVEPCGEKAVEKMKKSTIHDKDQKSQFQGLMKGLVRHVRNSKKPKPVKDGIGNLSSRGLHGKQKMLKKSHWWQLLKHHKGAMLPKKTHVKLGLGMKKTGSKALPKL